MKLKIVFIKKGILFQYKVIIGFIILNANILLNATNDNNLFN
jgi:hypothetical protein